MTAKPRADARAAPRPFVTTDEVAELLGLTATGFRVAVARLIEDQAFPVPMPYRAARGRIWRRDMVESWLSEQGRPKALPAAGRPEGPNVYLLEEARR